MSQTSQDSRLLTPGGFRPSTVAHVGPGETVRFEPTAPALVRTPLVVTPGGPRPPDRVHHIEEGAFLDHAHGELQLRTAAGRIGVRLTAALELAPRVTPAFGTGWITYSSWLNRTGTPISSFLTTWTVPRAPSSDDGQTIFLFNGIEPGDFSHILQPVLQWGPSAAGGGAYWTVASWYVGGGNAFHTNLVRVNEGDVLVGRMLLTGRNGSTFNYTSEFVGIAGTTLSVTNNPELTWASETLEAYSIAAASDYPATDDTPMTAINIRTGTTTPSVSWAINNAVTDTGQKTVIAVDGATNGEVELWYRGEAMWAKNDLTAAAAAPLAVGDPAGYTWSVDSTEHAVYRGADAHVHELWFNGSWHHNDLTVAAGAPLTATDPAAYTWSVDGTQHVVFVGMDNHVHELWFSGGWHHNDLTVAAGAPIAAARTLTGYTWDHDSTQHVIFVGFDSHVHELWFSGGWHHNDLTVAAGAPLALLGTPAGYTYSADTTEHVTYRGIDGHIHELWFNGAWHHNDLTVAAGAPLSAGDPTGYTWAVDQTQHNVYRGLDGHVHELWYNGAWHHNDLSDAAGGPPLCGSDPVGYTWDVDSTQHVVYRGGDGRIHELWFNGVWNYNDLTYASGNPGTAVGKPAGYTWAVDKTEHVLFRRADNHIQELYF